MLYCMALTNSDIKKLNNEILRVLKPGGINIYTVEILTMVIIRKGFTGEKICTKMMDLLLIFFLKKKLIAY